MDEIEEQHPSTHVALRDRHDQPKVRLDQFALRLLAVARQPLEPSPLLELEGVELAQRGQVCEFLGCMTARLDALGQRHFLRRGQQRYAPDLLEVHPNGIR